MGEFVHMNFSGTDAVVAAAAFVVTLGAIVGIVIAAGGAPAVVTDAATVEESGAAGSGTGSDDHPGNATPDMEDTDAAFEFTVENVEECGTTCRDVNVTLENVGDEAADDVEVHTEIYVEDDLIWSGDREVGSLAGDESLTETQRIDLSYRDALTVWRNDGWITIVTVVEFEDGTEVIVEEEQVD